MNEKETDKPLPEGSERSGGTSPENSTTESAESTNPVSEASTEEQQPDTEVFTIDDAINKAGYGRFQTYITFLAGLGWLADAFEVIILSIIGDMMACDWRMERWQNALLTSVVFAGMTVGAPSFGWFADRFGRRTALAVSTFFLFVFGASTAAAPDYIWMVILRATMGFFLGGIAQGVTICCEYYPADHRGRAGFYLSYYWSLGTIGVIGLAWLVMDKLDSWRIFVFAASIPSLIVFLTMKWYPESARYYLVNNQVEKAYKSLQRVARINKAEMPKGRLTSMDATKQMGKVSDMLHPHTRRTTCLFGYMWLASACGYYGIALITPFIVVNGSLFAAGRASNGSEFEAILPCKKFSDQNFINLLWTSAAEFPGVLIFSIVIEYWSRKSFLAVTCIITACMMPLLLIETKHAIIIFLLLFVVRGLVAGVFQLLFIMTSEAFPTTLRATALGMGSGTARMGGMIIPFLSQVAVIAEPLASMMVLASVTLLCGIAAILLPVDTRGREMDDTIHTM